MTLYQTRDFHIHPGSGYTFTNLSNHFQQQNFELAHIESYLQPTIKGYSHDDFFLSPITRRQILDSSKWKDFADDSLKFEENGRKLLKPVENTVGIGEIARSEQFLLFPQCFQMACFPWASKGVILWEWVNP